MRRFIFLVFLLIPGLLHSAEKGEVIKLPEIVIKGIYAPRYKDVEGIKLGFNIVELEKEYPRKDIHGIKTDLFERLRREELTPKSPGCAYRHSVTSFFAKAFKGADAYYKRASYFFMKGEYQKALKNYRELIKEFPKSPLVPSAIYWEGECLYKIGNPNLAFNYFSEVCEHYPNSEFSDYACYSSGWILLKRKKNKEKAYGFFEKVVERYKNSPVYPVSLLLSSYILYETGRKKEAEVLLKDFVRRFPNSNLLPKAYYILGIIHLDLGQYSEAEEEFTRSLSLTSEQNLTVASMINRGFSRIYLGKLEKSLVDFLEAKRITKEKAILNTINFGMLEVYARKGDVKRALEALRELQGTIYFPYGARIIAQVLEESGRIKDSIDVLRKIKDPTGYDLFRLGILYYQLGRWKESINFLSRSLQLVDEKDPVFFNMGIVFYRMDKLEKALDCFGNVKGTLRDKALLWCVKINIDLGRWSKSLALKDKIRNPELYAKSLSIIGEFLVEKGLWKETLNVLSDAVKYKDINCYPLYLLSEAFFNMENYRKAEETLEGILNKNCGAPRDKVCILLSKTLVVEGNLKKAKIYLEKCFKGSENPMYFYLKGDILYREGNYRLSSVFLKKAIDRNLSFPERLDAYLKLSNILLNTGEREEALAYLLKGEAEVRNKRKLYQKLLYALIEFYHKTSQFDYFKERAESYIKLFPRGKFSIPVRIMLGDYYMDMGRGDLAERVYKPLLEESGELKYSLSLSLAGFFKKSGDLKKAIFYFSLASKSKDPKVREEGIIGLATTFKDLGRWEDAIKYSDAILKDFPQSSYRAMAEYVKAVSLIRKGKRREGKSILSSLVANNSTPNHVLVLSLKELIEVSIDSRNWKDLDYYTDQVLPLLDEKEKPKYHILKCTYLKDPSECIKITYLYTDKKIISQALYRAAEIYYTKKERKKLEKVLARARKIADKKTISRIEDLLRKIGGGKE